MEVNERDAYYDVVHSHPASPVAPAYSASPIIAYHTFAAKPAQLEIITTSGSILSLLSRDQDVTMRPEVSIVISGRTKHGLDSQSTPPCLSFARGVAGLLM